MNKKNDKIILFDWGGLILKEYPEHYCDRDAITEAIRTFNKDLSYDEAYQVYRDTLADENGIYISRQNKYEEKYNWYKRVKDKGNLNATYEEFVETFTNCYKKIDKYQEVVDLIYSLKGKIKIGLFSDLLFVCLEGLKRHVNLEVFDNVFLSYEETITKARKEAFENVENKLNMHGKQILFIDNTEKNINNAKEFGWSTCLATGKDIQKIKEAVENFLNN